MFETGSDYRRIFDQRGALYHRAMALCPRARAEEFANMLATADLRDGQILCDLPAGGAYLLPYIRHRITYLGVESSRVFVAYSAETAPLTIQADPEHLPFADGGLDRVISLAGVHHTADKGALLREIGRCLGRDGVLALADVRAGSTVAEFLNGFVDKHSELGHQGHFLDAGIEAQLGSAGLRVVAQRDLDYPWRFENASQMAKYCALMFGIDAAEPLILEAIGDILGYTEQGTRCDLRWELRFIQAVAI